MIVFAAHTPHTPLLLETVAQDSFEKIKKTRNAIKQLEELLYISKPHILITISPHMTTDDTKFSVYAHTRFEARYSTLGDYTTTHNWIGIPHLATRIKHAATQKNIPTTLVAKNELHPALSVPLSYLTAHLPDVSVLPIGFCARSTKDHIAFGQVIKDIAMASNKRIAIISTGDLSHALDSDAPAGYHKEGPEFDKKIIELLESHNTTGIATLDTDFIANASEDGYRSLLILLGVIKNMNYTFKNLSYEHPFGVGYLTGTFDFA